MSAPTLVAGHTQEWHDQRQQGLGSSDVAAALGLSTFARPIDIWRAKRGLDEPTPDNAFLEWGRRLEPVIAEAAEAATGIDWKFWMAAVHHKQWPVAFTHLDRRGRDPLDGAMVALECKSSVTTKGWGEPATASIAEAHLHVPAGYAIQCAHHLLCTGYARVYLAALLGYREFRVYRFDRDEPFLDDLLADEQAFWQLVTDGIEPDPDGSEAYRAHLASRQGPLDLTERVASPEQQAIAARARDAKRAADTYQAAYELERQRLDRSMGDTASLVGPGWKASRTAPVIRTAWAKAVKDADADGIDLSPYISRHTTTGEPGFRFLSTEEE